MCGRFSLFAPQNDVAERFGANFVDDYRPRYNAAPSQELTVLPDATPDEFQAAEWGLVPTWADSDDEGGHINARAETAADKPTFEAAFRGADHEDGDSAAAADVDSGKTPWNLVSAGRCLVPADGFYEWGDAGDGRRPYRLEVGDRDLFAMAGLWTRWKPERRQAGLGEFAGESEGSDWRHTFAILTTEAAGPVERIHDRMPVILDPDEETRWLEAPPDRAADLLDPYDESMEMFAVSEEVNSPSNDRPSVVEPVDA